MFRLLLAVQLLVAFCATAQVHNGVELVKAALVADAASVAPGKPFTVGLHLRMAPGWHTYWQYAGDSGMATRIEWQLPAGFKAGEIQWPLPGKHMEEGDLLTYAYDEEVLLLVEITPPAKLDDREVTLRAKASWLVCEKLCIPGEAELALTLPIGGQQAPANAEIFDKFRARLPVKEVIPFTLSWSKSEGAVALKVAGLRENQALDFFPLPPEGVVIGHPAVRGDTITIPIQSGVADTLPGIVAVTEGARQLGWPVGAQRDAGVHLSFKGSISVNVPELYKYLMLGVLGGFILNLMPCVLPVIALKIFGFIKQAGETPEKIWRLGLAFVAGIFAWFLGLAALVVGFRAAGRELNWAFQFQHPGFLIAMMLIILVFALNLLGVFEIVLPSRAQGRLADLSAKEGYGGTFLHGMFATLMATPCTAPILGPALGFAVAQPPLIVFAMFGAIAAGMSLPYFVLSARPGWLRFLPKPGMWMVRLKQATGVLLLGTCVWLGWVLWQARIEREPFAPQFERALASSQTVFVDFTADWCVNCKVNERLVLNTEPIQRALREHDVLFLKADWTNGDPEITKLLRSFGRAGVPLYVVYPAGKRGEPIVLPELITQQMVLDALKKSAPGGALSAR